MRAVLYPGIVGATFSFIATILAGEILFRGVPAERLVPASQMIVQFDSFLTGGAVIAFSFFWGSLVREFRAERNLLNEWKDRLKGHEEAISQAEAMESKVRLTEGFLLAGIGGIVSFALSALLAIGAVITGNVWFLVFSLVTLAIGVGTMFWSWFEFHKISETISDLVEQGRAVLAKVDKDIATSSQVPK